MATLTLSDEELLRRLQAHPELRNRMESLLLVVENAAGDLKEADAAEMRVIEEIRRMGQEALTAWATRQVEKSSDELSQRRGVWREGKKTELAHNVWRHRSSRAAISPGQAAAAPFRAQRQGQASRLLAAVTKGSD
jgi:FAD/FMN-containing dehydrogenase